MERSGSRGREKPRRSRSGLWKKGIAAPEPKIPVDRARGEGSGQIRKRIYASKVTLDSKSNKDFAVEENSHFQHSRQSLLKKGSGTPIRALIDEEMSKESESRHHLPNVVARLMGLDMLPPKLVCKSHDGIATCSPHASIIGCQDKHVCCEDHSLQKSIDDDQGFKDVFEVVDMSKSERQRNQSLREGISSSKRSETDMAFIREKFMNAKHLSADVKLQKSKQFDDTLAALDSDKDLFLKFLQEPNSLFSKHLQDMKCASSPPHGSYITILKSSRGNKHGNIELCCRSEQNNKRYGHMRKEDIAYFRKPVNKLVSRSLKEDRSPPAHKLWKSDYMVKAGACTYPTQIVVLKPSLDNAQKAPRTVVLPRSTEDYQFDQRYKERRRSSVHELHTEGRARLKSSDAVEILGHRTKSSREIAREITEQMRHTMHYNQRKASSLHLHRKKSTDSAHIISDIDISQRFQLASNDFNYLDDCLRPSSSYSTETSVCREARKRLSERWHMTKWYQEKSHVDKVSGTLGEMLSLANKEMPSTSPNLFISCKEKRLAKDEVIAGCGYPSGIISSNDGWKDGCSRKLQRSFILPTSSVNVSVKQHARCKGDGNCDCYMLKDVLNIEPEVSLVAPINQRGCSTQKCFKCQRTNPPEYDPGKEKIMQPERGIHVNVEESRNNIDVNLPLDNNVIHESSKNMLPEINEWVGDFLVPETKFSSVLANEELDNKPILVHKSNGEVSGCDTNDIMNEEVTSDLQVESLSFHVRSSESRSPTSSKDAERPSPVSVLEPPEEDSNIGCFERVSADLKELRMQLQLLKLESSDTNAEEPEIILSDDDAGGGCHSISEMGEKLQTFSDESDRNFCYLRDVLVDSGFYDTDWDILSDACSMLEYPVQSNVFDNLEKKYSILTSWPRPERKLFFDLINVNLVEIIAPRTNSHPLVKLRVFEPMWTSDGLVKKIWQMVECNQGERAISLEKVVEPRWSDLEEDIDNIGKEIEKMLKEDLLEEIVSEFLLG